MNDKNHPVVSPDFGGAPGGLLPAIAQDADTGDVLMMAWMNREAWTLTLAEGRAVYWSRSRGELWRKGETSGHVQTVREIYLDCDGDTILIKVDQRGDAACHTGRRSCFYSRVFPGSPEIVSEPLFNPDDIYG